MFMILWGLRELLIAVLYIRNRPKTASSGERRSHMCLDAKNRLRVTEYLDVDLDLEQWVCNRCGHVIGPARGNYKRGCLLYDRDPREIHPPLVPGSFSFSPQPLWVRIVEFYCPGWGTQFETQSFRPGPPIPE